MSSSTFAVTEAENEVEKELNFGLEACEENGIGLTAQVDGEVPKDHTYTKDPDGSEDEGERTEESQEEPSEVTEALPEKRTAKKTQKAVKKNNPRTAKAKREASSKKEAPPKKEAPSSKKAKTKKDVLTEESNKSDDNTKPEKSEEKKENEDESKSSKRGKKRKVEEKENVIDRSIVEEVQNINEGDSVPDVSAESPAKISKTNADKTKGKNPSKSKAAPAAEDGDDNQNLPEGWVRKVVVRKSGKTAGQIDIYIYSPDGTKFRSRPDIAAYLAKTKSNLKLEYFNFSKKKVSEELVTKCPVKKEKPVPAVKPKNTPEKKKAQTSVKRGSKLLVKLNFSPKSKRGKNVRKTSDKQTRQTKSSVKKEKTPLSNSKGSKKKKSA